MAPPEKGLVLNEEGITVPGGVEWSGTEFLGVIKTPGQIEQENVDLLNSEIDGL